MVHPLEKVLAQRIVTGLKRNAITSCSKWAEAYRIMGQPFPGKWQFKHHPWTKEVHDCKADMLVAQKGAQLGFTEIALNKAFYSIDALGVSVLYVLPASTPDASNFSTSRFDPALESSPHLQNLFSDVKNIGHKRAGSANLFIRGSRSRSQLKSIPVGLVILDEIDEMCQENIPLVLERMSGQVNKQSFLLSTPTIPNVGINARYIMSTQHNFFFKCPHCSRRTMLTFPDSIIITAESPTDQSIKDTHLICKECKGILPHETKSEWLTTGIWVAGHTDRDIVGYHISQMYSMTVKPYELALSYLKSITNPADEQEFFNSKLGLTHVVEGAQITDDDIKKSTGSHREVESYSGGNLVTMGVDVGKWCHFEIDEWVIDRTTADNDLNLMAKCRVLKAGKVLNFEELDDLVRSFNVRFTVIDANPERRKALEFANRFYGKVKLCFYARGINNKNINIGTDEEHTINVDRTSWLDLSLSRFRQQRIILPMNLSLEYKSHIKNLVRIYEKDNNGNPIGRYTKGDNDEDHYAHARNYAEIALQLGYSIGASHNISGVL